MTENKRFKVINISENGMKGLFKLGNDNLSVYDVARLLNELLEENEQLKSSNLEYEDALARFEEKNQQLKEEVDYWKKRTLNRENEYAIEDSVKWLRENTVWEQMPTNIRTFTKTVPLKKKELDMND
jgi:hypothetical protein